MSYKICGQGPVTVPGCDSDSCETIVAQAKVELREEFQASREAQSEELKQFVGDSVSESDQSIRDDFASSQETQTNELMQAIANAVDNDVDYNNVSNKPAVNGVTLQGDKTLEELGIYEVTPEQAAAAEQAQEILEESAEILDRVSSFGRKQFDQTTVTEGPTSQITFDPPGYVYSSTDTYSVYVNGLRLTDDEYSREDNVITLTEPIADAGQKVEIVVLTYPVLPVAAEVMDARIGADGKTFPSLGDAIRDKANIDGYYEEMTVGDAEQLISTQFVQDSDPYLFRPTGGSADVGNREYVDKIVGGTVGWNQLYKRGNSGTNNGIVVTLKSDGYTINLNGTATSNAYVVISDAGIATEYTTVIGHKYLVYKSAKQTGVIVYNDNGGVYMSDNANYTIGEATKRTKLYCRVSSGTTLSNFEVYFQIHDLTAMFGTTIADYIYSLEQSQAGAGVAWFRNYFSKDYYPYDAGTLRSVEGVSAHETVGFNQWDTSTDNVGNVIANNGTLLNNDSFSTSDYIKVVAGATYYFKDVAPNANANTIAEYDADKIFIRTQPISGTSGTNTSGTKAMSDNTHYIRVVRFNTSTEPCINLHWDGERDGEYEPYTKHTYQLDSSLTLRGVPKLVDGKLAFDGDVYQPSGEVQRRYGIVDLGSFDWVKGSRNNDNTGYVFSSNGVSPKARARGSVVCAGLMAYSGANGWSWEAIPVNGVGVFGSSVLIVGLDVNTTGEAKAAMSGVYLVYELATPTTETAEGYEQYQICDPSGTEEFVTTGIVPVGHETRYPANLRDKLQHLPDLPSPLLDGTYIIMVNGSQMRLEKFLIPDAPTADGTYTLKATVSGGNPVYTWEVEA